MSEKKPIYRDEKNGLIVFSGRHRAIHADPNQPIDPSSYQGKVEASRPFGDFSSEEDAPSYDYLMRKNDEE